MPERWSRPLALLQLAVLLATFMSPAYAAGVVADPLHHAHVLAGDADHHHPGDLPDPAQDEGLDPRQLIGHVLAHLPPVAAADPIPALLEINDIHGNRVDLQIGLRGMDPELMNLTRQGRLADTTLEIVGREVFVAMKALPAVRLTWRMPVRSSTWIEIRSTSNCYVGRRSDSVATRLVPLNTSSAAWIEASAAVMPSDWNRSDP